MNQRTKEVRYIDVFRIDISGINYRKTIDEKEVKELAENIKNFGLINPITVRVSGREDSVDENTGEVISIPAKWQVVCGERRLRAYKYLGEQDVKNKSWQKIACIVYEKLSDGEMTEMMMTENLQRKDVEPFEEAFGFSVMLRGEKRSVEDVARLFGKTVEFVRNRIQLNNAIDEVRAMVKNGDIGLSIAMYVARFEQKEQRNFINDNILNEGCTLSSVKSRVENYYHSSLSKVLFSESEKIGDFRACELCPMNSACQGKLFGDMEIDKEDHYCRDRVCYDNKNFAKLLENIAAEPEGTKYSVWDEDADFTKRLKDVGVIAHEWWKVYKYADGFERPDKSDYDDEENGFDKERYDKDIDEWEGKVKKAIANKEVFRVINIKGYNSLEWDERIAELRDEAVNIECEDVDNKSRREVLEAQNRANLDKINENKNKKFRDAAKENDDYLNDGKPLSAEEIQLLHVLVMYQAGYQAHNIFKKDEREKEWKSIDDIHFSKEEYNKLVRGFIRESVTVSEVQWNGILKMCLGKYMEIADKKKYDELTEKYRKSYENKKKKIDLKIKELEG